jgi:hypothetical protein
MATIAALVAVGAAVAPVPFMRIFGIGAEQLTPSALLAWRLVAARNTMIAARAAQGDEAARDLFLPVQILDQIAWWQLHRGGHLARRPTLMAAAASGLIIALDLRRRLKRA